MKLLQALIIAGVLVGCGSSDPTSPLDPFSPEISSVVDNFQLQASNVADVTATVEYSWENTGTVANVDHSTTTSAGAATLVILDASDAVVYDATLEPSNNETTESGTSGTWTIRLVLADYDGTLNFRAQKP